MKQNYKFSRQCSEQRTPDDEKQRKIDSVRIDFTKDNKLPGLNKEDLVALGASDKPVLLKKNIIEKNRNDHPEILPGDYNTIIGQSLYNPDGIFPGHASKPYFNFASRVGEGKSTITLLEIAKTKDYYEIVNLHWLENVARGRKERKGERIKKS